jgi:hypothetical protein
VVGGRRGEADLDLLAGSSFLPWAAGWVAAASLLSASGVLLVQAANATTLKPAMTSVRAERADILVLLLL